MDLTTLMMTFRSDLRKELRAGRRALSSEQQVRAGLGLADVLLRQPFVAKSQHIAVYLANDGEIDPSSLMAQLWKQGKQCYLPVLDSQGSRSLLFVPYCSDTVLVNNKFGIPEPVPDPAERIAPRDLDLVLMPLTGFDEHGQRLGMGGGFYDKTFDFIRTTQKPPLVGLAHECQKVDRIPTENWDIPMQGVATDKCYYRAKS